MAPFAGYAMPIQYSMGTLAEHRHCRNRAGFFDISHMGQCLILGDAVAEWLEQLVPSCLVQLAVGQQKYTVLTNEQGGIIDDIMVTRIDSGFTLVVNAACKEKVFQHLTCHLSSECRFNELKDQALFALQGPEAVNIIKKYSPLASQLAFLHTCSTYLYDIACEISRSGYTGEDGFEIRVDGEQAERLARLLLAEPLVQSIGLAARNTLRLEAGLCLYGHEIDETITPIEAGLEWLLCKKRHSVAGQAQQNYPGAHRIVEQYLQGASRKRVGLLVSGKIPVRDGSVIYDQNQQPVGYVTSGGFSPTLTQPIAMAIVDDHGIQTNQVLYAEVREQRIPVTISALPLVPHRYHRS